jgi:hypothetical protein
VTQIKADESEVRDLQKLKSDHPTRRLSFG